MARALGTTTFGLVLTLAGCGGGESSTSSEGKKTTGAGSTDAAAVPTGSTDTNGAGEESTAQPGSASGTSATETTGGSAEHCARGDDLAPLCVEDWYSDGECDSTNNNAACGFDGGDCCAQTCVDDEVVCGELGLDCRDPDAGGYGDAPVPVLGDGSCDVPADPFDADALREEVALLSTDELAGRDPGFLGDRITRRYLETQFACIGLTPNPEGCFQQPFRNDDNDPTANIVGSIVGSDPQVANEIIVVGAHHDHLGVVDGEVVNGANDNISGVVALLAVARALSSAPTPPRRTIVFVAFGSEEAGLDGSVFFAPNTPAAPLEEVVYMVNLDMLGTYDIAGVVNAFGTFAGSPGRDILDDILVDHTELEFTLGFAAAEEDSDYEAFCAAGIPYVYFETFDPPCWHEPCDDVERMDFTNMSTLVQIKHDIVLGLADSQLDLAAVRTEQGCPRSPEQ